MPSIGTTNRPGRHRGSILSNDMDECESIISIRVGVHRLVGCSTSLSRLIYVSKEEPSETIAGHHHGIDAGVGVDRWKRGIIHRSTYHVVFQLSIDRA